MWWQSINTHKELEEERIEEKEGAQQWDMGVDFITKGKWLGSCTKLCFGWEIDMLKWMLTIKYIKSNSLIWLYHINKSLVISQWFGPHWDCRTTGPSVICGELLSLAPTLLPSDKSLLILLPPDSRHCWLELVPAMLMDLLRLRGGLLGLCPVPQFSSRT